MSAVRLNAHGGEVASGPAAGLRARSRWRHDEAWLATTPLPADAEPSGPPARALADLLLAVADAALAEGAVAVHWETDEPEALVDPVAAAAGLDARRDILLLRRSLPLATDDVRATRPVPVRPLRPGTADEEAWVRCNNRAFAAHPDQGRETVASLRAVLLEPWFDPAGFLLAEGTPGVDAGGDLDGYCWTKVHPATASEPETGEIYVIGVDPSTGGRGLGRSLVVAGLAHLAGRGITQAMLYVDADNVAARRLYDRLGFTPAHTRRVRSHRPGAPSRSQETE